ncbi:MAG: hypothetical protein RI965_1395 [Bacteroidota bacterium]|jgi:hypothetical protein
MRKIMAVLSFASLLMGCSVAYRSGQTPDDVYFSPARNNSSYVITDDEDGYGGGRYNAAAVPMEDRYLRMKSFSRSRWGLFDDDYAYWNNPYWNNRSYFDLYSYSGNIGFNNFSLGNPFMFNPISYYYSPFSPMYYGQPLVVLNTFKTTVAPKNSGPRVYNMSNYNPPRASYNTSKFGNSSIGGSYNNSNNNYYRESNYNSGGSSRIFSNNSSGGTYAPSSNSSSGSSGTAPVRSFPRGGNQ